MLPIINKSKDFELKPNQNKSFNPPKDLSQFQIRRQGGNQPSRSSAKYKVGGGFKLSNFQDQFTKTQSAKAQNQNIQSKTINYVNLIAKKSSSDINQQIREIQKKIRQCQKKIQTDKKRKLQQQRRLNQNRYNQDFEQIIKKQLELQGYHNTQLEAKNFDYLTNPGGHPQEEEPMVEQPLSQQIQQTPYNIAEGVQKLQKFYENSLKKKFQRREMFPHKACKRKTPKLYITQKTNALNKHGKPLSEQQHKFRVMTKQITPQQIYPVIPNFAVVKDTLSKNIVAYQAITNHFYKKLNRELINSQKNNKI